MKGLSKQYYRRKVVCKKNKIVNDWFSHKCECFGTCCSGNEPSRVKHLREEDEANINSHFEILEGLS